MIRLQEEPTPLPSILPDAVEDPTKMVLFGLEIPAVVGIISVMSLVVLVTWVFVRALISAGRLPPPAALVTALSVLTMLSIAGGIFSDNDEAWTIAAAGIGALAGSVTAVFRDERDNAHLLDAAIERMERRSAKRALQKDLKEGEGSEAPRPEGTGEVAMIEEETDERHRLDDVERSGPPPGA